MAKRSHLLEGAQPPIAASHTLPNKVWRSCQKSAIQKGGAEVCELKGVGLS